MSLEADIGGGKGGAIAVQERWVGGGWLVGTVDGSEIQAFTHQLRER